MDFFRPAWRVSEFADSDSTASSFGANDALGGAGGGGSGNGLQGTNAPGSAGVAGSAGSGVGGGIAILGTATIDDPSITGNTASTSGNDVDGLFSS